MRWGVDWGSVSSNVSGVNFVLLYGGLGNGAVGYCKVGVGRLGGDGVTFRW